MIQIARFPDGGFVLHKVMVGLTKYSAWFQVDGTLLDAEAVRPDGTTRSVPDRQTLVIRELTRIGRPFIQPQETRKA